MTILRNNLLFLLQKLYIYIQKIIGFILIALLLILRPLLGPAECKFTVGCTQYAVTQLQEKIFLLLYG
jgi:putative component of membrane protein insertase Oxa1/YidC/SpoIIIJ protein YidD